MSEKSDAQRKGALYELIPHLFDEEWVGHHNDNLLYVGARESRIDYGTELREAGYQITILEIYPPNVVALKNTVKWAEIVEGDVRSPPFGSDSFDVIFWWHGPEHIEIDELEGALVELEKMATHAVVLGCPWSTYCQGDLEGNPHECHVAHLEGPELKEMGYSICQTGTRGEPGSNIAAVKFVSPE